MPDVRSFTSCNDYDLNHVSEQTNCPHISRKISSFSGAIQRVNVTCTFLGDLHASNTYTEFTLIGEQDNIQTLTLKLTITAKVICSNI